MEILAGNPPHSGFWGDLVHAIPQAIRSPRGRVSQAIRQLDANEKSHDVLRQIRQFTFITTKVRSSYWVVSLIQPRSVSERRDEISAAGS